MTHIQPYPIDEQGRAGLVTAVLTELPEREALVQWCRKHVGGYFHLTKRGDRYRGHQLYEVWRPGVGLRYKFIVSRA